MIVTVTGVSANGIHETTSIDSVDENRKPPQLTVRRRVLAADLTDSHLQTLGFSMGDPQEVTRRFAVWMDDTKRRWHGRALSAGRLWPPDV